MLDLALLDGLNPAPLASAGWQTVGLEVPVLSGTGTVVCDIVLFNPAAGSLLVVEAKSGANLEPEQARRLADIDPQNLVVAGGITVPRPVALHCEPLITCLTENRPRIEKGLDALGLSIPVLAVDTRSAQLVDVAAASPALAAALARPTAWAWP